MQTVTVSTMVEDKAGGELEPAREPGPAVSSLEPGWLRKKLGALPRMARKLLSFIGPGAVISVAYVDPDNYQTAISAGASFQYKLLFMILVSNLIAIYLQVRRSLFCRVDIRAVS